MECAVVRSSIKLSCSFIVPSYFSHFNSPFVPFTTARFTKTRVLHHIDNASEMEMDYQMPNGVHAVPWHLLDLRSDAEIDQDLVDPLPVQDEKNIWLFWHSGFENMHPYTQRNVRAWHRRLSKRGWVIRVINRLDSSPLNVANFLDITDSNTFPKSFTDGRIGGDHAPQHTSDLVRWPLLLKYGGAYTDVGYMQIGDFDRMWNETIGNDDSPYEVMSNNMGGTDVHALTNYLLVSRRDNPFFARCHKLFLALWAKDGGKASTEGMHASPLLKGIPLLGAGDDNMSFTENGRYYGHEEVSKMLSDYITQGQVMTMVMGLIDEADGWNGPEYVAKHIYALEYMIGSQLINEYTAWDGHRAFELMSLPLPKEGKTESDDQKKAREIVENCLSRSFGFKLAHGLIIRVLGETLGSLWRKHTGADDVPNTYAHWLRHGTKYWDQDELPARLDFQVIEPIKRGRLLEE